MAIPKRILQDLLNTLSLSRLSRLCRFAWASKCSTKEDFVSRFSTKTCVYAICDGLTHTELSRFAKCLGVDPTKSADLLREAVKDAVWNYSGLKPDTSNKLRIALEKHRNLKSAAKVIWQRCDSLGWISLSRAEQIFAASMLVAEEIAKRSISFESMLFPYTKNVPSDWPTPVIKSLKLVGATKSALIVESWIQAAGLKRHKGAKFIESLDEDGIDPTSWTAKWKSNPEDIVLLMKSYLLNKPELF